ncbi:response regulator transcription factor [Neorhizobium sp. T25_27]|uniref:response regulator transcription factor n=1 Tax=Neorhizobium sp. T25_27 TaxID=2093831 RepID=UPI000CFA7496|nr:response regulator [Neorhizobium sp. T25_27]
MQPEGDLRHELDRPAICIVDDDSAIRTSLMDLFDSMEMSAICFESGDDFLARANLGRAGCILLDIHMPGIDGLAIQRHITTVKSMLPIVFMTGRATVPLSVQAMKRGASDFLLKPLDQDEIILATDKAVRRNAERRAQAAEIGGTVAHAKTLTPREKEVMAYVVKGYLSKQIAHELSVSEMMIKLHRSRMMRKMRVKSLAELVKKADLLFKHVEYFSYENT